MAIAGDKELTLPQDSTHLFSNTWPEGGQLAYNWELLRGPRGGTLQGRDQKDITLDDVSVMYSFECFNSGRCSRVSTWDVAPWRPLLSLSLSLSDIE